MTAGCNAKPGELRAILRSGRDNERVPDPKLLPPFSASAIEMVCRALGEALRGNQIVNLIAVLKVDEDVSEVRNTKWKRLFNAVVVAQNRQGDGRPLLRLVGEVMQPVRFQLPEEFEAHRVAVSERLLLSGYQVREDGKVARVKRATTLSEAQQRADDLRAELARRDVHPDVLRFCRAELMQQNYFHAVLEASKSVGEKLRNLSGLQGDGAPLVDSACSLSSGPIVAFNALSTDWERSEQTGVATLMKGVFGTFRNPAAHAPKVLWATSRRDALDLLTLTSMLHRRLDAATVRKA
ncbi:TIGR02391 family protein [soil metagenome]